MDYKSAPDLRSDEGEGKKKARVLGEALTDLVQASLRGEDGDVAVIPRARAAAHVAGCRKISPELGVVRGCVCVCCALGGPRAQPYTRRRDFLFLFRKKKRR